jgi:hypothetical protein
MTSSNNNYDLIYSHLCHMVVISREEKTNATIDSLIVMTVYLSGSNEYKEAVQVQQAISKSFGLSLPIEKIQSAIDRLQQDGILLRQTQTKKLYLDTNAITSTRLRLEEAVDLEEKVKQEWLEDVRLQAEHFSYELPVNWQEELWGCLQLYMAKAFRRHGVQTIMLLNPETSEKEEDNRNLLNYLNDAINEKCSTVDKKITEHAVRSFFDQNTSSRIRYVSQLLDATFTFFALTVDDKTSNFLRSSIRSMSIFLDTNIILGILDLHDNPLNHVAQELVSLIQTQKLPFQLYYHEATLKEIQTVITSMGENLKAKRFSQALSRVAIKNGQLSRLELNYHHKNVESPLDPQIFLSRYKYIQEILEDKGFKIYRAPNNKKLDEERYELVAQYADYIENGRTNHPNRQKTYPTINHDMAVLQTVRSIRAGNVVTTFFDAKSLFLTADYRLYSFDWNNFRRNKELGLVIMPNQLIQLIRPFIPTTTDFDRKFVETFAIPHFRTIRNGYETVRSKILSYLNTYSDISENTASRILANELLMQQLEAKEDDTEELKLLVDQAIIKDYENILNEKAELDRRAKDLEDMARKESEKALENSKQLSVVSENQKELRKKQSIAEQMIEESHKKIEELNESFQEKEHLVISLAGQLDNEKIEREKIMLELDQVRLQKEKYATIIRILAIITLSVILIVMIFVTPIILNWDWLLSHSKKPQLQILSCIIIIAISWAMIDKNSIRRNLAIGTVIFGALFTIFQIS